MTHLSPIALEGGPQDTREKYYRYYDKDYTEGRYISYTEYFVVRRTPKGVWISLGYENNKFVKDGARRRYAYPTKAEALESYRIRKRKQIAHNARQHDHAVECLAAAELITPEMVRSSNLYTQALPAAKPFALEFPTDNDAFGKIKKIALNAGSAGGLSVPSALAHIVRLCINPAAPIPVTPPAPGPE